MSVMAGDADLAPRPARPSDVKRVAALLAQAIDTSPFYGERFKQNEKRRLDERLLRTLIAIDPWHVALAWRDGEIAALTITIPEFGTLWSPWIYVVPGGRSQALGLSMIRFMKRHWDNGRFHKVACYVRPDNETAQKVFSHFGFERIAHLKDHLFGEDYLLYELPLTKVTEGYDNGLAVGRAMRLRIRWQEMMARFS